MAGLFGKRSAFSAPRIKSQSVREQLGPTTPESVLEEGPGQYVRSAPPQLRGIIRQYLGPNIGPKVSTLADLTGASNVFDTFSKQHYGAEDQQPSPIDYPLAVMDMPLAPFKALGILGKGAAMSGVGKAIFAGIGAKTADMTKLAAAKKAISQGVDREAVRKQTGWFQGADDKWRFEIDDSGARMTDRPSGELPDLLSHDALYENYPGLRKVVARQNTGEGISGYYKSAVPGTEKYYGRSPEIGVTAPNPEEAKGTLLHEAQHAVQDIEGFAKGGSPGSTSGVGLAEEIGAPTGDAIEQARIIRELSRSWGDGPMDIDGYLKAFPTKFPDGDPYLPGVLDMARDPNVFDDATRRYKIANDPVERYRALAGEVEARNVQARMDMSPGARVMKSPLETQEYPFDQQIVRDVAEGPQASYPSGPKLTAEQFADQQTNAKARKRWSPERKAAYRDLADKLNSVRQKRQAQSPDYGKTDPLKTPLEYRMEAFRLDKEKRAAAEKYGLDPKEISAFWPGQAEERAQVLAKRREYHDLVEKSPLWNKRFADEVRKSADIDFDVPGAVNRANMEAVPRALKKQGWTVRHVSSDRGKRASSRYVVSPDGKFEVRISDHELPETPERFDRMASGGSTRWDTEVVLTGEETPQSIVDDILSMYENAPKGK